MPLSHSSTQYKRNTQDNCNNLQEHEWTGPRPSERNDKPASCVPSRGSTTQCVSDPPAGSTKSPGEQIEGLWMCLCVVMWLHCSNDVPCVSGRYMSDATAHISRFVLNFFKGFVSLFFNLKPAYWQRGANGHCSFLGSNVLHNIQMVRFNFYKWRKNTDRIYLLTELTLWSLILRTKQWVVDHAGLPTMCSTIPCFV